MAAIIPRTLSEIDWGTWAPTEEATLMFVMEADRVLLIHKKLGLGAGKINGPGGRLEPGETPHQAAIRETEEEVCVTPINPTPAGNLSFQFTNGYGLRAHLFCAHKHLGTPAETDEAIPLWSPIDNLPFDKMWADDVHWLPQVLAGHTVSGQFIFDDEIMLDYQVTTSRAGEHA
jgi:8-oxo-dGTP diphosphatase